MFADLRLFFVRPAFDQLDEDAIRAFDERIFHHAPSRPASRICSMLMPTGGSMPCVTTILSTPACRASRTSIRSSSADEWPVASVDRACHAIRVAVRVNTDHAVESLGLQQAANRHEGKQEFSQVLMVKRAG